MGATMGGLLLALAPPLSSGYSLHGLNSLSRSCSRARPAHACAAATDVEAPPPSAPSEALVSSAILPMQPGPAQVNPPGCPNCESQWLSRSKETEAAEQIRLAEIRTSDHIKYLNEIYEYAQHMNDTQRQELALKPDTELRKFMIDCSTAPSPLMESVYNATMERVPYEQACYICGPEQAMLLRTLVGLSRPRHCLDIGCFKTFCDKKLSAKHFRPRQHAKHFCSARTCKRQAIRAQQCNCSALQNAVNVELTQHGVKTMGIAHRFA